MLLSIFRGFAVNLHPIIRPWVADPELMIRMLLVGYVFAIRSERLICHNQSRYATDPRPATALAGQLTVA
jgi:hypothetical protein